MRSVSRDRAELVTITQTQTWPSPENISTTEISENNLPGRSKEFDK